jgi:hypothetical protein
MTPDQLKEILCLHALWLAGNLKGVRANLTGADLTGADLTYTNLTGANLTGADLTGADLTGAVGNGKELRSAQFDTWPLTWTNDTLAIGCQQHAIAHWEVFDDERIRDMGVGALAFWRRNKSFILELVRRP